VFVLTLSGLFVFCVGGRSTRNGPCEASKQEVRAAVVLGAFIIEPLLHSCRLYLYSCRKVPSPVSLTPDESVISELQIWKIRNCVKHEITENREPGDERLKY